MKWFKHDSMSLYDPALRELVDSFGAEGIGIYWGIITYIACHSENLHVRISEHSRRTSGKIGHCSERIPSVSLRDLARLIVTTRSKLTSVIEACVEEELLDPSKWRDSSVLYSPTLAASQDEYSKKVERNRDRVRSASGQPPKKVSLQEHTEQETEEEQEEQKEADVEADKDLVDLSKSALNVEKLSTSDPQDALVPPVSDDDIKQFRRFVAEDIREWNQRGAEKFEWIPSETEISKLLRGGSPEHKLRLCYQAMNLLGGDATYPQVVRRAVGMMLNASRRKRITNPFGWLWTCLHGNTEGTPPWVQLATAREEG